MSQIVPNGLTQKQIRALRALVKHSTIDRAAKATGVSEKTIDRWLKEPVFRDALVEAEWMLFDEAIRAGGAEMADGMKVFSETMKDSSAAHIVKVKAAQALIDSVVKLHSHRQNRNKTASTQDSEWMAAEDTGNGQADDQDSDDSDSTPDDTDSTGAP
jgi:hypothetical protein